VFFKCSVIGHLTTDLPNGLSLVPPQEIKKKKKKIKDGQEERMREKYGKKKKVTETGKETAKERK
jgi:hypothetical protein